MILPLLGILFGALFGIFSAKRKGGKRLDLIQWGAVVGIIGGILGLFILVFIERAAING